MNRTGSRAPLWGVAGKAGYALCCVAAALVSRSGALSSGDITEIHTQLGRYVSGGAALIAALLAMWLDPKTPQSLSLQEATSVRRRVQKGRYVRAEGMVEARPIQAEAEQRQKALLGL